MSNFRLYPEEQRWWSFEDYGAVLDTMRERQPKRVLEFGPGSSTLALIEGGAARIDTCEDNEDWARVYDARLVAKFPEIVHLHRYTWNDPMSIADLDDQFFDLALIDGPFTTPRRRAVIEYAIRRSRAVLVPTEDHGRTHASYLRPYLMDLAHGVGLTLEIRETGPLSGGFALLTWPETKES